MNKPSMTPSDTQPIHLYVYYKVQPEQLEACIQASQTALGQLRLLAKVDTELLERQDTGQAEITLMETVRSRPLGEPERQALLAHFERLAKAQFDSLSSPVHRHLEVFMPLETDTDSSCR